MRIFFIDPRAGCLVNLLMMMMRQQKTTEWSVWVLIKKYRAKQFTRNDNSFEIAHRSDWRDSKEWKSDVRNISLGSESWLGIVFKNSIGCQFQLSLLSRAGRRCLILSKTRAIIYHDNKGHYNENSSKCHCKTSSSTTRAFVLICSPYT